MNTIASPDDVKKKLGIRPSITSKDSAIQSVLDAAHLYAMHVSRWDLMNPDSYTDYIENVRLWRNYWTKFRPVSAVTACVGTWPGDDTTKVIIGAQVLDPLDGKVQLSYSEWWPPVPIAYSNPILIPASARPFFPIVQLTYTTNAKQVPAWLKDGVIALAAYWFKTDPKIDLASQSYSGISESYKDLAVPPSILARLGVDGGGTVVHIA